MKEWLKWIGKAVIVFTLAVLVPLAWLASGEQKTTIGNIRDKYHRLKGKIYREFELKDPPPRVDPRGPNGEEHTPDQVRFERMKMLDLESGNWEMVETKDSLGYFQLSIVSVTTNTYIRYFDNKGNITLTVMREPDPTNKVFVVDRDTLKIIRGLGSMKSDQNIINRSPCVEIGVQDVAETQHVLIREKRDHL